MKAGNEFSNEERSVDETSDILLACVQSRCRYNISICMRVMRFWQWCGAL